MDYIPAVYNDYIAYDLWDIINEYLFIPNDGNYIVTYEYIASLMKDIQENAYNSVLFLKQFLKKVSRSYMLELSSIRFSIGNLQDFFYNYFNKLHISEYKEDNELLDDLNFINKYLDTNKNPSIIFKDVCVYPYNQYENFLKLLDCNHEIPPNRRKYQKLCPCIIERMNIIFEKIDDLYKVLITIYRNETLPEELRTPIFYKQIKSFYIK